MKFNENEEEPLTTPDTENSTRLNHSEGRTRTQDYGPGDYWKRLSNINTGAVDSFGSADAETQRRQERLSAWDVMAGHLELTPYQKSEGRRMMGQLKVGSGGLGIGLFLAAYSLAAYVVREDKRSRRDYHPRRLEQNNCPLFLDVADDFDYDPDRIHSVMNRLEDHV